MDEVKDPLAPKAPPVPVCGNLRCKGQLISGDDHREGVEWYDATIWWCEETQKVLGPDFKPAGPRACTSKRGCFKPPEIA